MKFKREGIYVIIAIIVIVSCVVVFYTFNTPEKSTLIGIIVAVGTFFTEKNFQAGKKESDFQDLLSRCYKTIQKELEDHETAFASNEYDLIVDNKKYPFKSMFLNVDAYESLLNSGLFTHFKEDTQQDLANLYIRIKLHNEYQIQRSLIRSIFVNSNNKEDNWATVIAPCDVILNRYQNDINDNIITIKKLIEEKENISSKSTI